MPDGKRVRLGLVGSGPWGLKYLAAAEAARDVVLKHVASPNIADKPLPETVSRYPDWHDLLDSDLDGLIVASSPDTHAEITSAALDAGLAVLVEKPVATTSIDAKALLDKARSRQGILHAGHIDLQNPALGAVLSALPSGADIQKLSGAWSNAGPYRSDTSPLWDWGPHPLACCLKAVGLDADTLEVAFDVRDQGGLYHLKALSGAVEISLTFGNGDNRRQRWMEITTVGHVYRYDDDVACKATCDGQPLDYASTAPLTAQVERFADAIRSGQQDVSDGVLSVDVIRLIELIEEKTAS